MAHVCPCGEELTVHVTTEEVITYCQGCGSETKVSRPKRTSPSHDRGIISFTRASILKKMNNKKEEEPKRPRQIRDRTNYTSQKGGRR